MAINFPANPSNGDVHAGFTYNSTKSVWEANSPSMMATSDTAPTSPSDGQMWFDTDGGGTFVYYEDADSSQWVEVIGSQGSPGADGAAGADGGAGVASVYATVNDLPTSGNSQGDMAHVTANNTLYFWNGSGWYKIALINTNPSISGVSSSYSLAIDGTATVVTVTASDPEGLPITYSIASDTSGNIATVTQGTGASSNVFTVTPSTNTADAGSFTLTFRASDGVNLATAPASFTLQFSVENSNYTTTLITSEGANNAVNNSFDDASTNNHTITASGNVTQNTFSPYRHGGYSTYFDGSGDYLNIPTNSNLVFGTGDFTIEGWFYLTAAATSLKYLFDCRSGGSNQAAPAIHIDSGTFKYYINGAYAGTGGTVLQNQWMHIALVRTSGSTKLYINGTSVFTYTDSINYTSSTVRIGSEWTAAGSYDWAGYITDFRTVTGTAVYTSTFTPPTERLAAVANTSLLTCHLPYIADGSTNSHSITVNGNTKTEPFGPYDYGEYSTSDNGGSMYFDGTGDYFTIPNDTSLQLGSSDWTIECWAYTTDVSGARGLIFQNDNAYEFGFYMSAGTLTAYSFQINASQNFAINMGALSTNQWYHLAVTRSGSTVTAYVNGSSVGTATYAGTIEARTGGWIIGAQSSTTNHFAGHITDARIVKGTAVYTSAFTPPTAPLTAITNTSLLLNGTDAGIIDKSQSSNYLVLNADTKCSSTQTKYRSTAIYTDGTGDTLQFGEKNPQTVLDWGIGGRPFTVEWWQYDTMPISTNHTVGPCIGGASATWNGSNGHQWLNIFDSSNFYFQWWGTNNAVNSVNVAASTMNFIQNQWQHIAAVYNGSTYKLYIDGTEQFSTTITNTFKANTGQRFGILGSINGGAYITAAYYDDLRVTKGLARYTANFTPPTEALKG